MGYTENIMLFIEAHEGEPIAKVMKDLFDKEDIPVEIVSTFADYCDMYAV